MLLPADQVLSGRQALPSPQNSEILEAGDLASRYLTARLVPRSCLFRERRTAGSCEQQVAVDKSPIWINMGGPLVLLEAGGTT